MTSLYKLYNHHLCPCSIFWIKKEQRSIEEAWILSVFRILHASICVYRFQSTLNDLNVPYNREMNKNRFETNNLPHSLFCNNVQFKTMHSIHLGDSCSKLWFSVTLFARFQSIHKLCILIQMSVIHVYGQKTNCMFIVPVQYIQAKHFFQTGN